MGTHGIEDILQRILTALMVGGAGLYWSLRASREIWADPVSRWLLRRGKVSAAMRLRFWGRPRGRA